MIQTNRLNLRTWQTVDLPFLDAVLGDPKVMEFSDLGVLNKSEQATWLESKPAIKHGTQLPGTLAIELKHDGQLIGYVSLSSDLQRVRKGEAELGFRLARSVWGQGIATEAANGIINDSRSLETLNRIVAIVDPHNLRSIHVLKKVGMTYESEVMFEGYDYPDSLYALDLQV